jgi:hypothetical protein
LLVVRATPSSLPFLMVPKNRNGPSGFEIPIEWDDRYLTARQGFPDEQYNWPSHKKTRGR